METRYTCSPDEVATLGTEQLRERFLVADLFEPGKVKLVYSHQDRVVLGGIEPIPGAPLALEAPEEFRAQFFLQRREAGIICVAGAGTVTADGTDYDLPKEACLYLSRGTEAVTFRAEQEGTRFYLFSAPAHTAYPTTLIPPGQGDVRELGDQEHANRRTLNRLIIPETVQSCQIEMGLTRLHPGSIWNTMPAHTHERRMEAYLYLDVPEQARVVHIMGRPDESRHLIVANHQATIAPSWSLHCGVGTEAYAFVWAMAGENQDFDDMDPVPITEVR